MLRGILSLALLLPAWGEEPVTRLACGSCYRPGEDTGIWKTIAKDKPQIFLFMGDTIYGDTEDMVILKQKYQALLNQPDYASFSKEIPVLATWDDHDYGKNDAGASYPKRVESQKIFLDTFEFPENHPSRKRAGIYHSKIIGPEGKRLQIIMLDTRYFRSNIFLGRVREGWAYFPQKDPKATMLGKAQWAWLEKELKKSADLRIIVSSIQLIMTDHMFEKWSNIPAERKRFLALLKKVQIGPTVILSGDRHLAEICRLDKKETELSFDLYELTASGMTHAGREKCPSNFRVPETYFGDNNYGLLEIDWSNAKPAVDLIIKDESGNDARRHTVKF